MTYSEAENNSTEALENFNDAISSGSKDKEILYLHGKYIKALKEQLKIAIENCLAADVSNISALVFEELQKHRELIERMNIKNKAGNYSMIKEMRLGLAALTTAVKIANRATTSDDKKKSAKHLAKVIGRNVKNLVKIPLVLGTRILSTKIVSKILFLPLKVVGFLVHTSWNVFETKPSNYDDRPIVKMSDVFNTLMTNLKIKTQKL